MQALEHAVAKGDEADGATGKAALAQSPLTERPPSRATTQGKAACACGGHCPRCQQSSPRLNVSISQPEEAHERQADDMAARVLRLPAPESKMEQQQQPLHDAQSTATRSPSLSGTSLNSSGQSLNAETRAFFEPRFGRDFSDVRVHTDEGAARSAQAVNAQAYTLGREIVFNEHQYRPQTEAGKSLLAHELAHVASHSEQHVLHRKPLPVEVPEPDEEFKPEYKYPWQNPILRKTIYPYRDEELSLFLRIYMEIDLDKPTIPATPVTAEEIDKERTRLTEQLKGIKQEIEATKKEQNEAKKITKERKEVDKEKVASLQDKIVDLSARAHRLEKDLDYLPTPTLAKDKKTLKLDYPQYSNRRWTAYRHSKLDDAGQDLSHDALLARILDRFDADKDFTRYPKWLRYMVIHFSGMRYDPAHGSYAPPVELIKRLKREQIYSELESASEREVTERAADAVGELEEELPTLKSPRGARAKQITSELDNLKAVEKERKSAFGKKGEEEKRAAFQQLIALEEESEKLKDDIYETDVGWEKALVEGNVKKLKELEPQIKALEDKIGAKDLKAERDRLRAAANRRREATIKYEIERAEREFSKLDDMQALSVIKAMRAKDAFPEWVWREIVRVTPLKLEEQPDSNWEVVTAEEGKQKSQKDPVTEKWRQIMREWQKNITGWREKHGDDLSLVVIRATCNEISEMAQHARGLQPTGGISQKTNWYAKSGGSGAYFSQPMTDADLKPGASLFFCKWSREPAKDAVSVVRHDLGTTLKSDSDEAIFDGFKGKGEWTYHFNKDKTVTRTRAIGSTADPADTPPQEMEYLNWFHEAVVVEVDANRKRVITFETGPIGIEKRAIDDVIKKWHIYIGYAPSGKEPADIDQYLKGILPGR